MFNLSRHFAIGFLGVTATAVAQPPPLLPTPMPVTIHPVPPPVIVISPPLGFLPAATPGVGGQITGLLQPLRPPGVVNEPAALGPGLLGAAHHHLPPPPTPPTVVGAVPLPRSKTPYSYGYFGPTAQRRWIKSHGYRDRSIRWTLR